jgi:hypothetical protein
MLIFFLFNWQWTWYGELTFVLDVFTLEVPREEGPSEVLLHSFMQRDPPI